MAEIEKELKYKIVSKQGLRHNSFKKVTGDEIMLKPSTAKELLEGNVNLSLQLVEKEKELKPVKP